jgi:hypothetical protein
MLVRCKLWSGLLEYKLVEARIKGEACLYLGGEIMLQRDYCCVKDRAQGHNSSRLRHGLQELSCSGDGLQIAHGWLLLLGSGASAGRAGLGRGKVNSERFMQLQTVHRQG